MKTLILFCLYGILQNVSKSCFFHSLYKYLCYVMYGLQVRLLVVFKGFNFTLHAKNANWLTLGKKVYVSPILCNSHGL